MAWTPLMAFLHHLTAFTLVGCLVGEVFLLRMPLSLEHARKLVRIDAVFGLSAAALLVIGMLRVQLFEKPASYYWHDVFFLIKLAAFLAAALISVYPTVTFLSWRDALRSGIAPEVPPRRLRRMRMCLMWELTAILVILACAAWMARGYGYFGG